MYDKCSICKGQIEESGFSRREDDAGKELHQSRWRAFLKKKKAMVDVSFEEVIDLLHALLMPIVQSMSTGNEFSGRWCFDDKDWKSLVV